MKKIVYICYGIFFLAFATQLWYAMSDALTFTTRGKICIVTIQVATLVLGTVINIRNLDTVQRNNDIRFVNIILFLLFIGNLSYLLFFDSDFGRTSHQLGLSFTDYFQSNVNLIPFRTIRLYIEGYRSGVVSGETMLINLVGNIIAFMPFAYFLPTLFKSQKNIFVFFMTMLFTIMGVEILQVIMRTGSGDVDDLILNLTGVMALYIIFKLPFINRLVYRNDRNGK